MSEKDGQAVNHSDELGWLPDDLPRRVAGIGAALIVGTLLYLRGYIDASDMSNPEIASEMIASGTYWPLVTFSAGMVICFAGLATWWFHER